MYFAINQDINNIEAYQYFLLDIIDNNNQLYKDIFKRIIRESKELSETGDFYSVNSDRFGIISFFSDCKEVIKDMDPENLEREDFEKLLACFDQTKCSC